MARSWETIARLYETGCGNSARAHEERWNHLGEAHRQVASRLDIKETEEIDTSVLVAAGDDSVAISAIDFSVYALQTVFNVTAGFIMRPEPSGMMGRDALLEKATGKPAVGPLTHYAPSGTKLYVRGTAEIETQLRVRGRRQVSDLSDADLASAPVTPQQYDLAIMHRAIELYYLLHPSENTLREGERTTTLSSKHAAAFESVFAMPQSPRIEEDKPRQEVIRVPGYRMTPRSARGGRR